ncbi:MAG: ABC transporter permease subunit [Proteobacteria bacterium]|nr:ABC transporter permease subunit [Cystobacterineae bacterium]MCL2258401.1 ABC transporter permease subunit [Cystobacterineae bacterium]MCL2315087.1 ABC transporter permease subunit [Pseudomonadota bacterium]
MRSATWVLFKKELREFLRDKRAIFFTLAMPVLAMPVVFGAILSGAWFAKQSLANETLPASVSSLEILQALQKEPLAHMPLDVKTREEAFLEMAKKERWAFVEAEEGFEERDIQHSLKLRLYYSRQQERSKEAKERLLKALEAIGQERLEVRFEKMALSKEFAKPLVVEEVDIAGQSLWLEMLAMWVGFGIASTLFLTSANLATDLVVGEKERGTLETLLSAPLRPKQILRAKQAIISASALFSAFLNLVVFSGLWGVVAWFLPEGGWPAELRWGQLAFLSLCFIPAALLASSLCIALASRCRTLKASQTATSLAAAVALMASAAVILPGMELSFALAWIPLVNLALLAKACVFGNLEYGPAGLTLAVTLALAYIFQRYAAHIFLDEQNLLNAPPQT